MYLKLKKELLFSWMKISKIQSRLVELLVM